MFTVEIKSAQTRERSGTSNATGKPYSFHIQTAWLHLPHKPYPTEIELTFDRAEQAYPVGVYVLSPDSFDVDRNKRVTVRPVLSAKAATAPKSAA